MTKTYRIPVYGTTSVKRVSARHRFPLKPDVLLSYLDQYQLSQIHSIKYFLRTSRGVLISARYQGELNRERLKEFGLETTTSGNEIGKSEIRVYSVGPDDERQARDALLTEGLPLLCEWLREAESQAYNWKRNDHSIVFKFKKGKLTLNVDEKGHW